MVLRYLALMVVCIALVAAVEGHAGEECWTAFECMDDGAAPCEGCGGSDWRCCNAAADSYGSDHPCSRVKVEHFSTVPGHKCARAFAADEHPGEECWSKYECTDDGDTPCDGCGGPEWYCCHAKHKGYTADHQNCKHVKYFTDMPGHRCAKMNPDWTAKLKMDAAAKIVADAAAIAKREAEMKEAIKDEVKDPEAAAAEAAYVEELIRKGRERRAKDEEAKKATLNGEQRGAAEGVQQAVVEDPVATAVVAEQPQAVVKDVPAPQAVIKEAPAPQAVIKEAPLRERKRVAQEEGEQEGRGQEPARAEDGGEDAEMMAEIAAAAAHAAAAASVAAAQAKFDEADRKQAEIHRAMLEKEAAATAAAVKQQQQEEEEERARAFEASEFKAKQEAKEKAGADAAAQAANAKRAADAADAKLKAVRDENARKRAEDVRRREERNEKQKKDRADAKEQREKAKAELEARDEQDRIRAAERQQRREERLAEKKLRDRAAINNLSFGIALAIVAVVCLWLVIIWKYRAGAKKLM